ncbi:MAG: hypothetical protein ABIJ56_05065 [Pseudomonadota bacterium]
MGKTIRLFAYFMVAVALWAGCGNGEGTEEDGVTDAADADAFVDSDAATWVLSFGGFDKDRAAAGIQADEHAYVIAGDTEGIAPFDQDLWVVKLGEAGGVLWEKLIAGSNRDVAGAAARTGDGRFIVAGAIDVMGSGTLDMWVLILGSRGELFWQKAIGGGADDLARAVLETADNGIVAAGETASFGAGETDMWIVKFDAGGNVEWQRTIGGPGSDTAGSILETAEGDLVVAGGTESFGAGGRDAWLVKLDGGGDILWQKAIGGPEDDEAAAVVETGDGGLAAAGTTASYGSGDEDMWVVRLDLLGSIQWQKTMGASGPDWAVSAVHAGGGEVAAVGTLGGEDMWAVKLGSGGDILWQKKIGYTQADVALSASGTWDGGLLVSGVTQSFGSGGEDMWVARLGRDGALAGSCPLIQDTAVTARDSGASLQETTAAAGDSSASARDTHAEDSDTMAIPELQCE